MDPAVGERIGDITRARELVEAWEASGLSMAAFCRQRKVASWSFYEWRRRLDVAVPALVEVKIAPRPVPSAIYEVELANGRRLRVDANFDDQAVARLVVVLEHAC